MDLKTTYPRSPREKLAGLIWIPRMLDKARASAKETLGEYYYPCPMDQMMLDFLQMDSKEFAELASGKSDEEVADILSEKVKPLGIEKKQEVNRNILEKQPDTPEKKQKFKEMLSDLDPTRTDVQTWAAMIDLEEGR